MNKHLRKLLLRTTLLFLMGVFGILAFGLVGLPLFKMHQNFPAAALNLETYDFFDLGIADINTDSRLDIFTSNHSARQNVALNNGEGGFTNTLTQLGLDQDRQFPDLEDSLQKPVLKDPGLYIYRYRKSLYIQSYKLMSPVSGRLEMSWPLEVSDQQSATADIRTVFIPSGKTKSIIDYTVQPDGLLIVKGEQDILELPHRFSVDPTFPLTQVFIGHNHINPKSHETELVWRDRHSFAWADINQDQKLDTFIVRGGVKGELGRVPDEINDELMIMGETRFDNQIDRFNFQKGTCPGRQAAWIDFNADNRLDLYIGCGRTQQPTHRNQLYQQQENGKFINVAARLGLDFPEDGPFRWIDFDNDGDSDLLIVNDDAIWLYVQDPQKTDADRFKGIKIHSNATAKLMNLLISDFDADGDPDVYVESKQKEDLNLLLLNENKRYNVVAPESIGLPSTGVGGSWVDYDNSGTIDFYIAPYGLYRQQKDHRFKHSKLLDTRWDTSQVVGARSAWFDIDNDGDRDLITITNQTPTLPIRLINKLPKVNFNNNWQRLWVATLYRNNKKGNHWLELELSDKSGNAQAIGARVTLISAGQRYTQTVGSTDSAYFSQGHFRLYFGLGQLTKVDNVEIAWPDGQHQSIKDLNADQLLQLSKNAEPIPLT